MRSASARAAFTIDSACSLWVCAGCVRLARNAAAPAGSGGSCGKAKPSTTGLPFGASAGSASTVADMPDPGASNGRGSDELLIVVLFAAAADHDRAGVLELADDGDDAA